jgi:hypothetical protein
MGAVLNRVDTGYLLLVDGTIVATDNDKLSKENCDEIFGVINIIDLAERNSKHSEEDYIEGFNKAVELNKDKVFTLEDMEAIFVFGHQVGMNTILAIQSQHSPQPSPKPDSDKLRDNVIQSLQQPTEIEVEIVQVLVQSSIQGEAIWRYKLDENLCLILKKL